MFDFKVTPDQGEPYEVTAASRDVLVFERTGKKPRTLIDLRDALAMSDLYRLAWIASRRLGLFSGELKDFEESVEIETVDGEEGEPDPTQPAPTSEA